MAAAWKRVGAVSVERKEWLKVYLVAKIKDLLTDAVQEVRKREKASLLACVMRQMREPPTKMGKTREKGERGGRMEELHFDVFTLRCLQDN